MALIELDHVDYHVDGQVILKDISLEVEKGKITTIIGPNGAGKTTLLRIMLGLNKPTSGTIIKSVGAVGYMPQKLQLNPLMPLSVERFLQLTQVQKNKTFNGQIDEVLHEMGACHLLHRQMRVLSGGELQRVMLVRSLLLDPELLILDEPAQGVDVMGQADLYDLIAKIRDRRGCGIVLVSHDLHLVMAASDEIICLNQHVCCAGHPHAIQQDPLYRALFPMAAYPQNVAFYEHQHDHRHDDGQKCNHGKPRSKSSSKEK